MSISNELGPSISCQKKKTNGWKIVFFPPESASSLQCSNDESTFPYLYLDLVCKHFCLFPRKNINGRNKSNNGHSNILTLLSSSTFFPNWRIFHFFIAQFKSNKLFPLFKMATLRRKRKLAVINKNNHQNYPNKNEPWDTNFSGNQEEYITEVSEKIEGRVTKKLFQ